MSDFIAQNLSLAQSIDSTPWLQPVREQAQATWQQQRLPNRKVEDWKYTSVKALDNGFARFAEKGDVDAAIAEYYAIPELDAIRLVFVNGHYSQDLSSELTTVSLPDGVELVRFSQANEYQQACIKQHLNSVLEAGSKAKQHIFSSLSNSQLNDGVFLHVPKNTVVETPLNIVYINTPQAHNFTVHQRALIVLEHHAQAAIVEQFVSTTDSQNSLTQGMTEMVVGENARLHHYRLNMEQEEALHIGGVHVNLAAHATVDQFFMGLGSQLKRVDVVVNHNGSGSHCEMKGIYLPRNQQMIDYHTNIEHRMPHCTSNEVFRGILADASKAVFNGRIHIHPDAQKTLAEMSNKNLLLSNKAEIKTKPELEIYADDVRCAHGATVSQIEDDALYYMQARGISRSEAEVMLSFGFINELLNEVKLAPIQHFLRPVIASLFSKNSDLTQHLY